VYYSTSYSTSVLENISSGTVIAALAVAIVSIIAQWKIFTKAGKPGWAAIIPFYNMYTLFEVAGMNGWMFLLMLIPIVNIIIMIMLYVNLAKSFGKSTGFAVGLIFLNFIFMLILGFGSDQYVGNKNA